MRGSDLLAVPDVSGQAADPVAPSSRGYLDQLDLFRVIACAAVVGNHSFIWANMSTNVVGTGVITLLHLSRNAFFFLSGLVICYAQLAHPRSWRAFWKRRYVQLGVPYLAWTGVYLVFSLATISLSWAEAGSFLRQNLLMGYSQLYPAFVIFQYVLVFPLLWRLLHATRRHGLIMGVSLGFALVLGLTLHYPSWIPPLTDVWRAFEAAIPWSRDLLTYQEFFVAGALVAMHFDDVSRFVSRHYGLIFSLSAIIGVLLVAWYVVQVHTGSSLVQASDPYQAEAVIWYFAAIASMFAVCVWRAQRRARGASDASHKRWWASSSLAALTGGVWLSHNLFLTSLRDVLGATGLRATLPWGATVAILFVGTVTISGTFVALVLRTRLRWVLGGPVRAEQRAGFARSPAHISRATAPPATAAPATAPPGTVSPGERAT